MKVFTVVVPMVALALVVAVSARDCGVITVAPTAYNVTDLQDCTIASSLTLTDNTALTSLSLPLLTRLNGLTIMHNLALVTVSLPVLKSVMGTLTLLGNFPLSSLTLPAAEHINTILACDNYHLTTLSFPVLTHASVLDIWSHDALVTISAPQLWSISDYFLIMENSVLTSIDMNVLNSVAHDCTVMENAALTELSLFNLEFVGGQFHVETNNALTTLIIHSLMTVVEQILITDNPALSFMDAECLYTVGQYTIQNIASIVSCDPVLLADPDRNVYCDPVDAPVHESAAAAAGLTLTEHDGSANKLLTHLMHPKLRAHRVATHLAPLHHVARSHGRAHPASGRA